MSNRKKFYAVKKGNKIGIFDTWTECEAAVKGYKGAIYKGFENRQAASQWFTATPDDSNTPFLQDTANSSYEYDVYTDGSYSKGSYSYAYAFVKNGQIVYEGNGVGQNSAAATMRNVAGEIAAVLYAVKRAAELEVKICIHHDYQGVASWVNGDWQAKNEFTQTYVKLMKEHRGTYGFQKVQAHSGNLFNDYVDKLAKEALGLLK